MKITCHMCGGQGSTHEVILPPSEPSEWWEDCQECAGTGLIEIPLLDYIKYWFATLIFKIKCLPYRLNYKQPIEDNDIPF